MSILQAVLQHLDLSRKLPVVTTRSPTFRPWTISTRPFLRPPVSTVRRRKRPGPVWTKNDGLVLELLEGRLRDDHHGPVLGHGQHGLDVHAGPEAAGRIGDLDPPLDGPGLVVHDVAEEDQPAVELLSGIGLGMEKASRFRRTAERSFS